MQIICYIVTINVLYNITYIINIYIYIYIYIYTYLLTYFSHILTRSDLTLTFHHSRSIISVRNSSYSQSQSFFKMSMNVLGCLSLCFVYSSMASITLSRVLVRRCTL